ncbi:MAG: ComEC/Rec2 family competence protein [Bdellovibrionales bacterium]
MWLFLLGSLTLIVICNIAVLHDTAIRLAFLQQLCLNSAPVQETSAEELWQALVCGKNLENEGFWSTNLKASGLVHIFVVSGSHFRVLEFLLTLLPLPHWVQVILLWIYNGLTGLSAPGTRACLQVTGARLWQMRPDQNLLVVSLICLSLNPLWVKSHSFWLSWLASLVLVIAPRDPLQMGAQILFFSVWGLLGFQLSLWSLLLNLLLAPLVGWLLFPLGLLAYFSPFDSLFELSVSGLESLLRSLSLSFSGPQRLQMIPHISFLVLSLHVILHGLSLRRQGRRLL